MLIRIRLVLAPRLSLSLALLTQYLLPYALSLFSHYVSCVFTELLRGGVSKRDLEMRVPSPQSRPDSGNRVLERLVRGRSPIA